MLPQHEELYASQTQRNCSTYLGQLIAYGWERVIDGHAGGRRCQYAGGYNGVWRHQPRPTELTDSGSHRRSSTAWWTVNNQRTMVLHAEHESRLQLLNPTLIARFRDGKHRRRRSFCTDHFVRQHNHTASLYKCQLTELRRGQPRRRSGMQYTSEA